MMASIDFPPAHPLDNALSVLGHMVRRGRASALTSRDLAASVVLLDHELGENDADPDGLLRARLQMLWRAGEAETLTRDQFEAITSSIRKALVRARDGEAAPAVLPPGVQGRRIGRFLVVEGGLNPTPNGN